jgi:hypothetical protein
VIASLAVVGALVIRIVDNRLRAMAATVPCGRGETDPGADGRAQGPDEAMSVASEGGAQ